MRTVRVFSRMTGRVMGPFTVRELDLRCEQFSPRVPLASIRFPGRIQTSKVFGVAVDMRRWKLPDFVVGKGQFVKVVVRGGR